MNKFLIILIGFILFITLYLVITPHISISSASINKDIFAQGEPVEINWKIFCFGSCSKTDFEIYELKGQEWTILLTHVPYWSTSCVNGILKEGAIMEGRSGFFLPIPKFMKATYTWKGDIYNPNRTVEKCFREFSKEELRERNGTFRAYIYENASKGEYQFRIGNSPKANFRIE